MAELLRIEQWAENLREVTMGRWLAAEGDAVAAGESLCEVITEKVTFEYECPVAGLLLRIYAPEKSAIPVGYACAGVGRAGAAPPEGIEDGNARLMAAHEARLELDLDLGPVAASGAAGSAAEEGPAGRVRATPPARKAARAAGVALADVAGWVAEDRPVTEADVAAYLDRPR